MTFGKDATVAVIDPQAGHVRMLYGATGITATDLQASANQVYTGCRSKIVTADDRRPTQFNTPWRR